MNLLIIGAPGSGKGTMSKFIVEDYKVKHVSTGDMLRQAVKDQTEVGLKAKSYMEKGELVPDSIINDIIVEFLKTADMPNGFLFDGYPRTLAQAEALSEILKSVNKKIDAVINLNIATDILVKRTEGRRLCSKCGASFNIFFSAPKQEGVCDKCGGNLYIRADDNAESLKIRLDEFYKNTKPVVEYYDKLGLIKEINANQDRYDVYNDIKKAIEEIQ